jgi:hypothetical protein
MANRGFWVVAALAIGLLQAWDSNALQAGSFEQFLVGIGMLLPVASIAAPVNHGVRLAALVAGAVAIYPREFASRGLAAGDS